MKRIAGAALVLGLVIGFYPNPVLAQETEKEAEWSVVLGVGGGVPARGEEFTDKAKVGGFIVAAVERRLSDLFVGYGKVDLSQFSVDQGSSLQATTLGAGVIIMFDLFPDNAWRGGFKIGASRANRSAFVTDPSMQADFGVFAEGDFKGDSRVRIGADLKTYQGTSQISAGFLYVAVKMGI